MEGAYRDLILLVSPTCWIGGQLVPKLNPLPRCVCPHDATGTPQLCAAWKVPDCTLLKGSLRSMQGHRPRVFTGPFGESNLGCWAPGWSTHGTGYSGWQCPRFLLPWEAVMVAWLCPAHHTAMHAHRLREDSWSHSDQEPAKPSGWSCCSHLCFLKDGILNGRRNSRHSFELI